MRSRMNSIVSCSEVHQWALLWLLQAELLKDRGGRCTPTVIWSIVLRAAARGDGSPARAARAPAGQEQERGITASPVVIAQAEVRCL